MGNSGAKYKTKKDGTVVLKNVPENFKAAFERACQNGELNLIGARVGAENWPADAFDQLPQLWKVDASRNNIAEFPPTLHKHHGIKVLHFMRNQITRIPNSIGSMKRLMVLDISYNQITALPREIGECYALHTLLAGNNRIQEVPDELSRCDKLTKLHLNDNQLKGLPPSLVKLSSCLTEIRFDANPLWEQLKKRPELVDVDNRNEATSTYDIPKCLAYICAGGVEETGKPLTLILFEKYDQDRSGTIDKSELKDLCYDFGYYMNEAEFELAFMKLDRDGGGTIGMLMCALTCKRSRLHNEQTTTSS
jgi:Leucine-rich repeat (LRR) protein